MVCCTALYGGCWLLSGSCLLRLFASFEEVKIRVVVKGIVVYCVLMIFIYLAKMVFEFIRMKMGEGAYPWCSHGV